MQKSKAITLHARLELVQAALLQNGFSSLADCLIQEIQCPDTIIQQRVASKFIPLELGILMSACFKHSGFSLRGLAAAELCRQIVELVGTLITSEMILLARRPEIRHPLGDFTHGTISNFSLAAIAQAQQDVAPISKRLVDIMVAPARKPAGSAAHIMGPRDEGEDTEDDTPVNESTKPPAKGRKRDLISTTVLCVAAYGHSQKANSLAGMIGYYLNASNAGKAVINNLHALGISVAYESVNVALRANAVAVRKMVRERCRERPFFISFDNMVFTQRVKNHTMQNRQHCRNYTAGYVAFLQGAPSSGFLLRKDMLDWKRAIDVTDEDLMTTHATLDYTRKAAASNIWRILYKYYAKEMAPALRKHDRDGNIISGDYNQPSVPTVFPIPLVKSDLHTMTAFAKDESIITEVIEIIQLIVDELDLPGQDLMDKLIMFKGDYMTVRNILYITKHPKSAQCLSLTSV